MLKQERLFFVAVVEDPPDGDANVAAILARVHLRRLAPATIEQRDGGGHTRPVIGAVLGDASQYLDREAGMGPRQGTDIGRRSSHLARGLPFLLAEASRVGAATITLIIISQWTRFSEINWLKTIDALHLHR